MTLFLAWLLTGCGPTAEAPEPPAAEEPAPAAEAPAPTIEVVYVMASRLRMRPQPRSDTETFERLPINTKLRKVGTDGDWVQVTAPDGRQGYVHGDYVAADPLMLDDVPAKMEGSKDDAERLSWAQRAAALSPRDARALERLAAAYEAVDDQAKAKKVRRVIAELSEGFNAWFPEHHGEFDAITAELSKAESAATLVALYKRALGATEAVSEPLNTLYMYGERTIDGSDEQLAERVPWAGLTFYAEGTHAALELDTDTWVEAAKRTTEPWDDDFFALQVLATDQVSGRGWNAWQQREWDYGGCSPFGNSEDLHLRILLAADPLRAQSEVGEAVEEVRRGALRDIEQPSGPGEFPYCRHMGSPTELSQLVAEAEKIAAQVKLTEAESAMVARRISEGFGL